MIESSTFLNFIIVPSSAPPDLWSHVVKLGSLLLHNITKNPNQISFLCFHSKLGWFFSFTVVVVNFSPLHLLPLWSRHRKSFLISYYSTHRRSNSSNSHGNNNNNNDYLEASLLLLGYSLIVYGKPKKLLAESRTMLLSLRRFVALPKIVQADYQPRSPQDKIAQITV